MFCINGTQLVMQFHALCVGCLFDKNSMTNLTEKSECGRQGYSVTLGLKGLNAEYTHVPLHNKISFYKYIQLVQ